MAGLGVVVHVGDIIFLLDVGVEVTGVGKGMFPCVKGLMDCKGNAGG